MVMVIDGNDYDDEDDDFHDNHDDDHDDDTDDDGGDDKDDVLLCTCLYGMYQVTVLPHVRLR